MSPRAEELLGKLLLIVTFGLLATGQMAGLIAVIKAPDHPPLWGIGLVTRVLSVVFVLLIVVLTLRRLPASRNAAGFEPRLAAVAGTFLLILLVWLPPGHPGIAVQLASLVLLLAGTAGSIYCLSYLGRSFSILASARELVTGGPYGIVRHPLYVAEGISTLGIILAHWSWPAVLVGAAQFAVQWRRMQHEERVLRAAFPAYADYAQRVPMVLPGSIG